MTQEVRPAALRPGDTVMLVSPAGPVDPDQIGPGIELLRSWGLHPVVAPHAYARRGFLAGTDAERAAGVNAAFADPAVRGVIMTRGGYGCQRMVDLIDMSLVRADPKVVAGFSDITALQLALWRGARLATVHGPGALWRTERTGPASAQSLRDALMSADPVVVKADPGSETAPATTTPADLGITSTDRDQDMETSPRSARVSGRLLGGNLSLLSSSVGTVDMPDLTGAILLLEEVDEPPYKVDRMLTQLRRAGALDRVAGVAVGQFTRCADGWPATVAEVLTDRLGDLGVPVLGGLPIGHGQDQITVPLGVPGVLDVAAGTLTTEPAVTFS